MELTNPPMQFPMAIITKRPEVMGFLEYKDYQKQLKKGLKEYKKGEMFFSSRQVKQVYTSDGDTKGEESTHIYKK